MRKWMQRVVVWAAVFVPGTAGGMAMGAGQERPNILWLVFEDTSATNFACYGNKDTKTPVVDGLAQRGILFERACSVAPQCSPARGTLISGSFSTTYGTDIHRQKWRVPEGQYFFPPLLRKAGYFCTNNTKTDYNAAGEGQLTKAVWDEQGGTAGYNSPERKEGQPFFAVFNNGASHMTRVHTYTTEGRRRPDVDPATVTLPPFVPDLPEILADYALHLEGTQDIDRWVGTFLQDLEKRGLAEETIVFVYGDNGGCLPRGKAFAYESGLHVPLVVYVPEKWRQLCGIEPGTRSRRLVGFEDFAPTVLKLAGLEVPGHMQGRSMLAPGTEEKEMQFAFRTNTGQHYDPVRTANDGRYKYIRSFMPQKPLGMRQGYQWGVPGQVAWDKAYREGKLAPEYRGFFEAKPVEQLFDLQNDPWEMKDLAGDPSQRERLERMRGAVARHMRETKDLGLFPRSTRERETSLYEWVRETNYPVDELIEAAEVASVGEVKNVAKLVGYLNSERPEVRFWGASGFATLAAGGKIKEVPAEVAEATKDENEEVAALAAEALCRVGRGEEGLPVLVKLVRAGSGEAASGLEGMGKLAEPAADELMEMRGQQPVKSVLINLGRVPIEEYFGKKQYAEGVERNGRRMEWRYPSPDPAENKKRPKEEAGD